MNFDCLPILPKCEALCCNVVPIEKEIWNLHKTEIVSPVIGIHEGTAIVEGKKIEIVLPLTSSGKCPFLTSENQCGIYDDRPSVCRKYGDESHKCLRCPFQDKNGRLRTRQEKRKIFRDAKKESGKLIKRLEKDEIG